MVTDITHFSTALIQQGFCGFKIIMPFNELLAAPVVNFVHYNFYYGYKKRNSFNEPWLA